MFYFEIMPVPTRAEPLVVEEDPNAAPWDDCVDVLVVGFGAAGACAALEAAAAGATVRVLDRFAGGGATAISGGVFYGGGGTHIQREAGVQDSVDNMRRYLAQEIQGVVSDETLRDFCRTSSDQLTWLERHGVPFDARLCPVKTSYPTDEYFLYYSGNESVYPYSEQATPAPRGHRVKGKSLPGRNFYEPLRRATETSVADVQYSARVVRLVTDAGGAVIGAEYHQVEPGLWRWMHRRLHHAGIAIVKFHPGAARALRELCVKIELTHHLVRRVRARRGVVIAAGGFIYNREMVAAHAPRYRKGMPLGTAGDDGSGILLGKSVGGATTMMDRVSAWRFINPPQAFAEGILVNARGERYVNEFKYGAAIGEAMVEGNQGVATLVIDAEIRKLARAQSKRGSAQWFQRVPALINLWFNSRKATTIDALAKSIGVPPETLRNTVETYNRAADGLSPDPFHKPAEHLRALRHPPYYAIDCSLHSKRFPCPTLTLGGLVVDERTGQVKRDDGTAIAGLYAAGRAAVGICSRQYVSGLSLADCVFSGRRAGRSAAETAERKAAESAEPLAHRLHPGSAS